MLGLLDRFRKKEKLMVIEQPKIVTELERLCGGDKETFEALVHTMFLDPRKVKASMKEAVENAKKFEKAKDTIRTRIWYEIAGGLAIYEGNPKKVQEYFGEAEKISPEMLPEMKYPILKNPEKAVAKAQEYYKQHLESGS
jgi:hypothetical protein